MDRFKNIEDFGEFVAENIKQFLPEQMQDASFKFQYVNKNNDTKQYGISVAATDSVRISPNVYLDNAYEKIQNDSLDVLQAVRELAQVLSENYLNPQVQENVADNLTDFSFAKDKILPKLISAERSSEYLVDKPHEIIGDIAKVYVVNLGEASDGRMSCTITNDLLKCYGISQAELDVVAMDNLTNEKYVCKSMHTVLAEMMHMTLEEASLMFGPMEGQPQMYVLTNEAMINGAAGILNTEYMDEIAGQLGGDLIVLPSSIHETLLLPFGAGDIKELNQIVNEVNATQVAPNEFLSDSVYVYDSKDHELMLSNNYLEKMSEKSAPSQSRENNNSLVGNLNSKVAEANQKASNDTGRTARTQEEALG